MWFQMVEPTVISLFAGCGGSSLGYKLAGFKELLAVEWDDNAVQTFKLNFPEVPIYRGDICKLSSEECMKLAEIKPGELDILDGSPPCQGFSTAGKRNFNDSRNSLFKEYCRLLRDLQPKVFVFENVSGLIKGYMKQIYLEIIKELRDCGYKCKGQVLNAMYFNVPQSRERVIIIGVRKDLGIEPSHPKPQNEPVSLSLIFENLVTDTKEAFELTPKYIRPLLKKMGDYEVASKYSNGTRYFNHKRNSANRPSRTILKTPDIYHYSENRLLTREELKIIGGYPIDYQFCGDLKDYYNRIGNSVPPPFMKAIAEHIRINILNFTGKKAELIKG